MSKDLPQTSPQDALAEQMRALKQREVAALAKLGNALEQAEAARRELDITRGQMGGVELSMKLLEQTAAPKE